jgi:hypothetical protein
MSHLDPLVRYRARLIYLPLTPGCRVPSCPLCCTQRLGCCSPHNSSFDVYPAMSTKFILMASWLRRRSRNPTRSSFKWAKPGIIYLYIEI